MLEEYSWEEGDFLGSLFLYIRFLIEKDALQFAGKKFWRILER